MENNNIKGISGNFQRNIEMSRIASEDERRELNDEEFQFYKEQLKKDVKSYLEIDDQIKALNKALRERRTGKTKLADSILKTMKIFDVDNMNTKNGRLIYSVTKTKQPLNKKNLLSGLKIFFNNEEKSKEATDVVLSNRQIIEKITLKRTINKNTNIAL